MNLSAIFRNHAKRRPMHPAVVARESEINYRQFDRGIDIAARLLADKGIRKGDVVGIGLKDTPEHMAFLFAIARLGAIILPIDRRWTPGEKARTLEHFRAKCALIDADDDGTDGPTPVYSPDIPLFDETTGLVAPVEDAEGENLPLLISLSSGTTGRPKGPLLTHENFFHRFLIYFVSLTFNEQDRFACSSPLYFSGSRGFSMCIMYAGATLVLLPPPVPAEKLIQEINDLECTSAFIVPTMLRRLMSEHKGEGLCFPNMRVLVSTGAALFPEDRERAAKLVATNILNFYGSAEGGGISVLGPNHAPDERESAGAIVFGSSVRIVDQNCADLPAGQIGRICYRSGATAKAYYNDQEASAVAFHDGWYFPGDLGYINERGYVFITGREKDMIIRAGVNIYPNEIESILLGHPLINEAAVIGVPSNEFGEEVVAYLVAKTPMETAELRAHCEKHLARYKIPVAFHFLKDVPRTSVGKIDKRLLAETAAQTN
jgi:long-chain acyl-CoA synthetase